MTGNKKVLCKTCYKEMRRDKLARHMKQHFKKNENNPVTNIDSMIKRIMNLQKECTELSNKYPSNWISNLQQRNQNLLENCFNMRKESRQKKKETQELKQKLAEARKARFETEAKYQKMLSSYDDTDSEDTQMNSESEDEIIEDMEQVAADMKNDIELNKTVEDKKSNK